MTDKKHNETAPETKLSRLRQFLAHVREDIKRDFKYSEFAGLPFFLTRGMEVNYFFILPSVSTLAVLMLIFVPLRRFPAESVFQISFLLLIMANIACLLAVAIWRFLVERHYSAEIEKRRQHKSKSLLRAEKRFASPFLTPENAHPARHLLGLWAKDNLLYILPSVLVVALFPPDILMLDPVMDNGISSIFTYIVLFAVMANLLMLCAIALLFLLQRGFSFVQKITRMLSGESYIERR